ncbi:MAG: redox-regulated ATPase YchF [Candidatus Zixiibacteriota bacterium]|nr:MAG: redox-regulated ATPase YchF [candidate division Zixibacteria bacterium]
MKLGIIGKPQCGKTTIFNAASGQQEAVGDYSQTSHRAIIKVPDERVDKLAELEQPKKVTHAEIEFLDAPGFTGKGKESGALEISHDLRMMDALIMVIDAFSLQSDPQRYIPSLIDEMILADLTVVENNLEKKSRRVKLTGDKSGIREIELLQTCRDWLENEKSLIELDLLPEDEKLLRGYTFLSQKPLLIVLNIAEEKLPQADDIYQQYSSFVSKGMREIAVVCGKIEAELVTLDHDERAEFMSDLGISTPAVEQVIQKSYSLVGLISFLTTGKPETRAWTIKAGTIAQKAAGVIHSDIEKGFIRAEVTPFEDYIEYKTLAALRAAGKTRLEGKEYIVRDGDVILFRFNV